MFDNLNIVTVLFSIPLLIMIYVEVFQVIIPSCQSDDRERTDTELRKKFYLDGWVQKLDLAVCGVFVIGHIFKWATSVPNFGSEYGAYGIMAASTIWLGRYLYRQKYINIVTK